MSEAREFTGSSAAEAAINACEEFGVNRSDIEWDVVSQSGEGIDREVVISVQLKEGVEPGSANVDNGDERRETRSRGRGDRGGRGDRDRGRGGRDRGREVLPDSLEFSPAERPRRSSPDRRAGVRTPPENVRSNGTRRYLLAPRT